MQRGMMKIITSHERTDMDGLASIYAAALLYPDYLPVLPAKLNRNLRDFCTLYRDALPFVERDHLPRRRIAHLILVDTQTIAPLKGLDASTQTHIIDHHPLERKLSDKVTFEGEAVGATTSLLMARIRDQEIELSELGASLLLMGIYEDTGSLSYLTTTAKDAQAAAWLLEEGADLSVVSEFLHRPLTGLQRETLARLVNQSQLHTIHERAICVSATELDQYVDELSSLIHPIMDLYEPEACFVLAGHRGNIQVIARSGTDAIDVSRLMQRFGGGGHSKAAAALVQDGDLQELVQQLLDALEEQIDPPTLVREIMSTNVHTLKTHISIRDAAQLMRRYGHEGFPVVEDERLVGILTRRDVDRAVHHRLGDMPVRGFLHTGPVYVRPQDPVGEVQRVMIEHDLGQVPVVSQGRFVGIVTRTDLIKLWSPSPFPSRAKEIQHMMQEALPDALRTLLIKARDVANDLGYSLYIVGGFVRDLLLGMPTLDLDLVVEGDAIDMARHLAPQLGGQVRSHARFGTAKVLLGDDRQPGIPSSLDFVTARTEFYERPTVLPQVERSSIKQDLYRRDFTINTMAVCLDRDRYGELLDFYGGERDIGEGCLRVLHNLSFIEDPTRILRAVRFEQRLGFTIEERTARLIGDALELLDDVSGDRLRNEIYLILEESTPERTLERLERLGALFHIHKDLGFTREMSSLFGRLRERFHTWPSNRQSDQRSSADDQAEDKEAPAMILCYLALLTSNMKADQLDTLVSRLHISKKDARFLHEVVRLRESISELATGEMLPSTIYRLLHPFSREALFVLSVLTESELVRERMRLYERELAGVEPQVSGHFLKSIGVTPGPIYGEILDRVRDALLDGQVSTLQEEQQLASRLAEAAHRRQV